MKKWRMVLLTVIITAGFLVPTALAQGPNLPNRMYPGDWRRVSPRLPNPPPKTTPEPERPETLPPIKIPIPGHQPDGGRGSRMPMPRPNRGTVPDARQGLDALAESDSLQEGGGESPGAWFQGNWAAVQQWMGRARLLVSLERAGLR